MVKRIFAVALLIFSGNLHAQQTAWQWYNSVMAHLAAGGQTITVQTQVTFSNDRIETLNYKYGMDAQSFYAQLPNVDYVLTGDWYVQLNHSEGFMLIDVNINAGDREERLEKLIEAINKSALSSTSTNVEQFFSVIDLDGDLKKILIDYGGSTGPFSTGYVLFNSSTLEIEEMQFEYDPNNSSGITAVGTLKSAFVSYDYSSYDKNVYLNIEDVFQLTGGLIDIKPAYSSYKIYNMTGFGFIGE